MINGEKGKKANGALHELGKGFLIFTGSILTFFLFLYLLAWFYYVPENPPDQYKTSIVYRGRTDMVIPHPYNPNIESTPEETVLNFLGNSGISYAVEYEGKTFAVDIYHRKKKTRILQILQEGIEEGDFYIDDQNYLVTK